METELTETTERGSDKFNEKPVESNKYDISEILRLTGHNTAEYPNGLTLGVKLEGIPGTQGVHIDVVFVLDLRKAMFGKGGLAMRAAVLESVNRNLERVLVDVGLGDCLVDHTLLTPWERIHLPLLKARTRNSLSYMHETRTIYVISEDAKPSFNLSWLTDASRIVTADQFSLARQSDTRSSLSDIRNCVQAEKWSLLEAGIMRSWTGLLAVVSFAIALGILILALSAESVSIFLPLIICSASGVFGGWFLISSRRSLSLFNDIIIQEQDALELIGDRKRISNSIAENEERLRLLADLNFIISPLMANVGDAISSGNVDNAVNIACSALDECVRLAPKTTETESIVSGDKGLQAFTGLFEHLSGDFDEAKLALAYVGLTSHVTKRITFGEAVAHISVLVNSLYDIGALRPNIKESLDDRLNMMALKEAADEIEKEMHSSEETTTLSDLVPEEMQRSEPEESGESLALDLHVGDDYDMALNEQILHASKPSNSNEGSCSDDVFEPTEDSTNDLTISAEDVVKIQQKKQKRPPMKPTYVSIDDFEYLRSTNESKEREPAGV